MAKNNQRGRKDHYIPRGYLKCFIDSARENLAKPFWKFDLETKQWSMESPGSVGWERGFYDYADANTELEHPDETFDKLEREFSLGREYLLQRRFKGWGETTQDVSPQLCADDAGAIAFMSKARECFRPQVRRWQRL